MASLAEVLRQAGYVTPQGVTGPNAPLAQQLKNYATNVIPTARQNLAQQRADIDAALTMGQGGVQIGDREAFERQMAQVPNLMGSVNLPRKDLIAKQIDELESTGRATAGGQIAESNGFFYKGGQFLPTTTAEPGKWKIGKKWVTSSRELIEPGVLANTPTPFSRGILGLIKDYTDYDKSGNLIIKQGPKIMQVKDGMQEYVPVSAESVFTPGVKGVLNKEPITLGELIEAYNKGQRWFDVQPDAVTITTKKVVE
jgi:hypothetical protein